MVFKKAMFWTVNRLNWRKLSSCRSCSFSTVKDLEVELLLWMLPTRCGWTKQQNMWFTVLTQPRLGWMVERYGSRHACSWAAGSRDKAGRTAGVVALANAGRSGDVSARCFTSWINTQFKIRFLECILRTFRTGGSSQCAVFLSWVQKMLWLMFRFFLCCPVLLPDSCPPCRHPVVPLQSLWCFLSEGRACTCSCHLSKRYCTCDFFTPFLIGKGSICLS